jgi:hypothetical protein
VWNNYVFAPLAHLIKIIGNKPSFLEVFYDATSIEPETSSSQPPLFLI